MILPQWLLALVKRHRAVVSLLWQGLMCRRGLCTHMPRGPLAGKYQLCSLLGFSGGAAAFPLLLLTAVKPLCMMETTSLLSLQSMLHIEEDGR